MERETELEICSKFYFPSFQWALKLHRSRNSGKNPSGFGAHKSLPKEYKGLCQTFTSMTAAKLGQVTR